MGPKGYTGIMQGLGIRRLGLRGWGSELIDIYPPTLQNQIQKDTDNEIETGLGQGCMCVFH